MAFCCPDLCKSRAWDAFSIDIIIQHSKLDRDSGKAAFLGSRKIAAVQQPTPLRSLEGCLTSASHASFDEIRDVKLISATLDNGN
jgi:hypothetical protein